MHAPGYQPGRSAGRDNKQKSWSRTRANLSSIHEETPDLLKTHRQPFVGQRLRALREQADMTLAELSEATGVTISAIHRLECGQNVRLTTYFPLWCFFAERDPQVWVLAEAIVLLPAADRANLVGLVDPSDRGDG